MKKFEDLELKLKLKLKLDLKLDLKLNLMHKLKIHFILLI